MAQKTYSEKLKDPRWQKKRLEIYQRDNFTCQDCKRSDITLNVHHLSYQKGKEPWEYEDENFLTLCEICHAAESRFRTEQETHLIKTLKKKGICIVSMSRLTMGIATSSVHIDRDASKVIEYFLSNPEAYNTIVKMYREKNGWNFIQQHGTMKDYLVGELVQSARDTTKEELVNG